MEKRIDNKNASVNHQGHPRQEGQQGNIPPIHHADGQRHSDNQGQPMSNMKQESEEQRIAREKQLLGDEKRERGEEEEKEK